MPVTCAGVAAWPVIEAFMVIFVFVLPPKNGGRGSAVSPAAALPFDRQGEMVGQKFSDTVNWA